MSAKHEIKLEEFYCADQNNILCRKDFTCCNTCGNCEIYSEKEKLETDKDYAKKYEGYVFYHSQETDHILDKIENNITILKVHLNWDVFRNSTSTSSDSVTSENPTDISDLPYKEVEPLKDMLQKLQDNNKDKDKDYDNFAEKLIDLANTFTENIEIKYDKENKIFRKLEMYVDISDQD